MPTRDQCFECHTDITGVSIGLELAQLNRDVSYELTGRTANQVDTLEALGLFDAAPSEKVRSQALAELHGSDTLEARAKAYLHANCAFCHRPGGIGFGDSDLRFDTPLAYMRLCGQPPMSDGSEDDEALLITPGVHAQSLLTLRMRSLDPVFRMPSVGSAVVDTDATKVVEAWIDSLTVCPTP